MNQPVPSPSPASPLRPRGFLCGLGPHLAALLLAVAAVGFTLWFLVLNPGLPLVFRNLAGSWVIGPARLPVSVVIWSVGAVALLTLLGWLALECFELYLPRGARLALAYIFGLGLTGVVLEWLAIPYWLSRRPIAAALGGLLGLLILGAWLRTRRPPESGLGGEAGPAEHLLRRALAREAYVQTLTRPIRLHERVFRTFCVTLIAAITLAIFWHALLYPEVYWDSLILYLGYARMTFLQHGFPIKVTGQVGIGLGANYPHLYAVLGAGVATAMGTWSEFPQQLMAPLAGLATTVLVYHIALRLTRHVNAALAFTLLYRAMPLAIAYDTYASDYALAMLFGAAFLYLALRTIDSGLRGWLGGAALLIGLSMHLNYLMGILWGPWLVAAWLGWVGWGTRGGETADPGAPWTALPQRPGLGGLLLPGRLWGMLLLAGAIGSTWYLRNWIVTDNPVYAFFYKTLGGKYITPAVMEASAREWMNNGAGIGKFSETVAGRVEALPIYLFGAPGWSAGYRLMPLIGAFSLGGFCVWLARWLASPLARRRTPAGRVAVRFGLVVTTLAGGLLVFHVVLAPFYLYQIIKLLPCLAVLAALAWPVWQRRPWRWLLGGLALGVGLVPGLAMALMGFKIGGMVQVPGSPGIAPTSLYVLRHPLAPTETFYQWRYGDDARMWRTINRNLQGRKLLTHENRHLVLHPTIQLIHLDDWDIQKLWLIDDPAEVVRRLVRDFNIHYYLYVPNESNTATNARLRAGRWPELGLAKQVFAAGENRLFRLIAPETSEPVSSPPDQKPAPVKPSPTP